MGRAVLPVSVFCHHHPVSGRIAAEGNEGIILQPSPEDTFRATPNRGGLFYFKTASMLIVDACNYFFELIKCKHNKNTELARWKKFQGKQKVAGLGLKN